MFNISLPFILFDNMKKTIFHLLTEGVLNEIFTIYFMAIFNMAHSFSTHTKEYFDGRKVCLIVKFDYNILYGISVHLWKRN